MIPTAALVAALGGAPMLDLVGKSEPVGAETPIMRLFRQCAAILVRYDEDYRAAEAQGTQIDLNWWEQTLASKGPERHRIKDAIPAEPPTDLRDPAIKVMINSGEGARALDDKLPLEFARLAGRDFDRLPQCLFEKGRPA